MKINEYSIKARCSNCGCVQEVHYPKGKEIQRSISGYLVDIREDQSRGIVLHCCGDCECWTLRDITY